MSIDPQRPAPDGGLLRQARDKLRQPEPKERHWAALAAAALFAVCAIVFAAAAVLAPPLSRDPAARSGAP